MGKKNLKFSKQGFQELRKQPGVRRDLLRRAKAIAAQAGGEDMGYKVTALDLEDPRGAASVMATGHAARHDRKHNSLLKSLEAGRG